MTLNFKITGGMYPGQYRSTAVKVTHCEAVGDGYPAVEKWYKANFQDWNHISPIHQPTAFHVAMLNAQIDIQMYFGGRKVY